MAYVQGTYHFFRRSKVQLGILPLLSPLLISSLQIAYPHGQIVITKLRAGVTQFSAFMDSFYFFLNVYLNLLTDKYYIMWAADLTYSQRLTCKSQHDNFHDNIKAAHKIITWRHQI